jgi:putative glutamine amidotransferase
VSRRPIIAVTGPDRGGTALWLFLRLSVTLAGGRPRRVTPSGPHTEAPFHGLVLSGGADVDPGLYGQNPIRAYRDAPDGTGGLLRRLAGLILLPLAFWLRRLLSSKRAPILDHARDRLETRLALEAMGRGAPVLGICRGAQLLNVLRGGTLHQDLSSFYTETPMPTGILPRKSVRLMPGSLLARIVAAEEGDTPGELRVNALHRQAIDRPGEGLRVCAREDTGVIQAVELAAGGFVLGVQWHPELLPHLAGHRALFHGLVQAARSHGTKEKQWIS